MCPRDHRELSVQEFGKCGVWPHTKARSVESDAFKIAGSYGFFFQSGWCHPSLALAMSEHGKRQEQTERLTERKTFFWKWGEVWRWVKSCPPAFSSACRKMSCLSIVHKPGCRSSAGCMVLLAPSPTPAVEADIIVFWMPDALNGIQKTWSV